MSAHVDARSRWAILCIPVAVALVTALAAWLAQSLGDHAGAAASVHSRSHSTAHDFHGVDQSLLQKCIESKSDCLSTVPGLSACMQTHNVCYQAGAVAQQRSDRAERDSGQRISSARDALRAIGWTPSSSQPVATEETTYANAGTISPHLAASDQISRSTEVWISTQYFNPPISTVANGGYGPAGSATTVTLSSVTTIVEAAGGIETDACENCAGVSLSSSEAHVFK